MRSWSNTAYVRGHVPRGDPSPSSVAGMVRERRLARDAALELVIAGVRCHVCLDKGCEFCPKVDA